MRIRTRLTLAIAGVLLITIASLGYVLVRDTRAALVQDVDDDIIANALKKMPKPHDDYGKGERGGPPYGPGFDGTPNPNNGPPPWKPADWVNATPVASGPTIIDESDDSETDLASISERTVASFCFRPNGDVVWSEPSGFPDEPDSPPLLPEVPSAELAAMVNTIQNVSSEDGTFQYRMLVTMRDNGDYLFTARSLQQVESSISRLIRTILVAGSLAVAAAALASWLVIRRGFEPVDQMIGTAEKIAAGDLTQRVPASDPHTELGRLGSALNEMLGQVEQAALVREDNENRLRRFVADAAHELRTPLTSLRGYAELYRQGALATPESVGMAMGRIEAESRRMGRLVDDLLLLARMDQQRGLEMAPVDIGEVVTEAITDFEVVDPARPVTVEHVGDSMVIGDRHRLRQIIDNLLSNVRTHTPAETPVHVVVSPEPGFVDISVEDKGPGIAQEDQERVFERFWRADPGRVRSRGGTGLGLAIVASLVQAHGGSVAVDSELGRGTKFTVRLPTASSTMEAD
ncbi:MAG: HAMP domain-containing histidine kinase [Thermomicrobiales bacterium]|nr:HAMP domain-containing histidine kinase [Thermomicrobiales bacterium]MCO5222102.1 HAMP domain-containing histidine kinase [Thermomicrobiales bacterium]